MSDHKKDLTRIEDLEDFHHEDDATDDYSPTADDDTPPDLPSFDTNVDALPDSDDLALPGTPSESEEQSTSFDGPPAFGSAAEDYNAEAPNFGGDAPSFGDDSPVTDTDFGSDAFTSALSEPGLPEEPKFDDLSFSVPDDIPAAEELTATIKTEPTKTKTESKLPDPEPEPELPNAEETKVMLSEVISLADVRALERPIEKQPDPAPRITPDDMPYRPREDFAEVRSFAENAVLADVSAECNPAYSVIAQGVKFLEDSDDILLVLRELKFPEELMQQFQRQLERGSLLIPRVSEFTAIYLAHRLRRFRLDLQMGPSDLLHPPRGEKEGSMGLVSRRSLGQNQHHQFHFEDQQEAKSVLLSTLAHLDGHTIERYLGVATESSFLDSDQVEGDMPDAINSSYDELAQKLKAHALQHKANAVVGINYQLTPMPSENHSLGQYRYKLTCTGNLVRVSRPSA